MIDFGTQEDFVSCLEHLIKWEDSTSFTDTTYTSRTLQDLIDYIVANVKEATTYLLLIVKFLRRIHNHVEIRCLLRIRKTLQDDPTVNNRLTELLQKEESLVDPKYWNSDEEDELGYFFETLPEIIKFRKEKGISLLIKIFEKMKNQIPKRFETDARILGPLFVNVGEHLSYQEKDQLVQTVANLFDGTIGAQGLQGLWEARLGAVISSMGSLESAELMDLLLNLINEIETNHNNTVADQLNLALAGGAGEGNVVILFSLDFSGGSFARHISRSFTHLSAPHAKAVFRSLVSALQTIPETDPNTYFDLFDAYFEKDPEGALEIFHSIDESKKIPLKTIKKLTDATHPFWKTPLRTMKVYKKEIVGSSNTFHHLAFLTTAFSAYKSQRDSTYG